MALVDLSDIYQVGTSEKVKEMEACLEQELAELRTELEEVDLPAKTTSSVPIPEKKEHFFQERKLVIKRALEVSVAQPVQIQAEQMRTEMENTEKNEYTVSSLPLLLHQYFTERIQQVVHLKHQYMLRWRRFCQHTSIIEALYSTYNERLVHLLDEYRDCIQRAQRLSVVREAIMHDKPESAVTAVCMEDLLIYLRWLVCSLHSMKRFNQYLKVLQWMPTTHKTEITPPNLSDDNKDETDHAAKMASRYRDDIFTQSRGRHQLTSVRSGDSGTSSTSSSSSSSSPVPVNVVPLSTTPLPSTAMTFAAAANGGEGLSSDELMLGIPIHTTDLGYFRSQLAFLISVYGINFDLNVVHSSADEMELFAAINRKFRHLFNKQEHMNHFKTYDRFEAVKDKSVKESAGHTLKKEANWCRFVSLYPERDPQQETAWAELQQRKHVDELLKVQAHFMKVGSSEKVQEILKKHAAQMQNPQPVPAASLTSHKAANNMATIWRKIYSEFEQGTSTDQDGGHDVPDFDEKVSETVSLGFSAGCGGSAHKRRDSYDYVNTIQMLGLDEGDKDRSDPVTAQGAFLSYLFLRHLRIRDMQRSSLSVLNYFRSIERTLTINDQGLADDDGCLQRASFQSHRTGTDVDGSSGGSGGLGYHGYMHNTPADFKMSESDFIQFSAVENHDDFYVLNEGHIHVQDLKGHYIMYDKALEDLRSLEHDLLLVCSHYIEKDRNLRSTARNQVPGSSKSPLNQAGNFDIPSYAHQDVDRFQVLLDVWTNEVAFLECKRELLDCYYEAYQHVVDRDERRRLAQIITNVIHQRPRIDQHSEYFVKMYRAECSILRLQAALVKSVLDSQIETERLYIQRVTRDGDKEMGLPHCIIPKQPVAINLSRPALKNIYILEFHPSLAIASRIPVALKHAFWELHEMHQPDTLLASAMMEKKLLEVAVREWQSMPMIGSSFSTQVQKDLFSDVFAEDPLLQCDLAVNSLKQQEEVSGRRTHKEKQTLMVQTVGRLMNILTSRHRMIEACWETEILSRVYKKQAVEMGFPEYHMNLRFVQFEFASFKEKAGKPPPVFITSIQEDDTAIDKYSPSCLSLAIHELDEGHVGKFSFRGQEGMLQVMRSGGMESFQVVLKVQVVHKNALIAAVQQVSFCNPVKITEQKSGRVSPTETKSEKSSVTQGTSTSSTNQTGNALSGKMASDSYKSKKTGEAFFSIQLEKTPSRDLMLNDFVNKKQHMGSILRNSEEVEKVKRMLISEFCERFHLRLSQASMRGQLLAYYTSILNLLSDFPSIRDNYFVLGVANEKKSDEDSVEGLTVDPRTMKKLPRRLLSSDGQNVLNIWFIPHHTEVLVMYKTMDDSTCCRSLAYSLSIVGTLHDILQYLTFQAHLNSLGTRAASSNKMGTSSVGWDGADGIGSELREIQKQIQNLRDSTDPQSVLDLLSLQHDVMFLKYEAAVRSSMTSIFLAAGNTAAYKSLVSSSQFALSAISSSQKPSLMATNFNIPEPLEARDPQARNLFPWRAFINSNGPYSVAFTQWFLIRQYMDLCLTGLKDVDRHVANGEILGVDLLMEDVLQTGNTGAVLSHDLDTHSHSQLSLAVSGEDLADSSQASISVTSDLKELSKDLALVRHTLSRIQQPMESYRVLRFFLLVWKCLEILKLDWGKKRLMVEKIDNPELYKEFCKVYRTEVLLPALQSVARRLGQGDFYENIVLDTDVYVVPRGASEIEVKLRQLLRLLENLECHMITEVRKRVSKELTLAVAERTREEEAWPTDLWKKSVIKESFTMNRPHIAEKFADSLMSQAQKTDTSVTFNLKHLSSCLSELAQSIMLRERQNFESYSTYYENLLRAHHQLLFQREQEVKHLKDQLKQVQGDMKVSIQCQLANEAHDLLMEVTALRAKIAEMRELSLTQERDIRERVREEYENLIHNIFNSTFQLRSKFDEFRSDLQDDVLDKVTETRREAVDALSKLQQKFSGSSGKEDLKVHMEGTEQIRLLQHENHLLNKAIVKLKAMNTWRQNIRTQNSLNITSDLQKKAEDSKKELLEMKMLAEEEVALLQQQIAALRKALTSTEKDSSEVRKVLQRELKMKAEKHHEDMESRRSKQQLELIKQMSVEKLIDELTYKEKKLKQLQDDFDRSSRQAQTMYFKTKKDMETFRRQFNHERSSKLDAFERVDVLQSQVYDLESCLMNRSASSITPSLSKHTRSRATSAHASRQNRPSTVGGSKWTSGTKWPVSRSITSHNELPMDVSSLSVNGDTRKIQRPKTVGGRLRSKIAEFLLAELEPDNQGRLLSS